jgi:hypothetical protein|tara:strand:+ start:903 stop:1514 length:612 start_codon:yes stop_codon:yes gene_type:complete
MRGQITLWGVAGLVILLVLVFMLWMPLSSVRQPLDISKPEVKNFIESSYGLGLGCYLQRASSNSGGLVLEGDFTDGEGYLLETGSVLPKNFSVFFGREIVNHNNEITIDVGDSVSLLVDHSFRVEIDEILYDINDFMVSLDIPLKDILNFRDDVRKIEGIDVDLVGGSSYFTDVYQKGSDSLVVVTDRDHTLQNEPFQFTFLQ